MKARICAILFFSFSLLLHAEQTSQQNYLAAYLELKDGETLEKQKDYLGAPVRFKVAGTFLEKMRDGDPNWEPALVAKRINDCREKIAELEPLAAKQVLVKKTEPTLSSGPPVSMLFYEGIHLEKTRDYWGALNQFETYSITLEMIHRADPQWEATLIEDKIKQSKSEIDRVETRMLGDFKKQEESHKDGTFH